MTKPYIIYAVHDKIRFDNFTSGRAVGALETDSLLDYSVGRNGREAARNWKASNPN